MAAEQAEVLRPIWRFMRSPLAWLMLAAAGIGIASFLWPRQLALWDWLPWAIVLACPLMHIFGHKGHRRHQSRVPSESRHDDERH